MDAAAPLPARLLLLFVSRFELLELFLELLILISDLSELLYLSFKVIDTFLGFMPVGDHVAKTALLAELAFELCVQALVP